MKKTGLWLLVAVILLLCLAPTWALGTEGPLVYDGAPAGPDAQPANYLSWIIAVILSIGVVVILLRVTKQQK